MGVLDQFREKASETYSGFLTAKEISDVGDTRATIQGWGTATVSDGKKPYVLLEGAFGRKALILSRGNGRRLAEAGTDESLMGAIVALTKEYVDFRGKQVGSIRLVIPHQSKP
jgi:hypothetical protein